MDDSGLRDVLRRAVEASIRCLAPLVEPPAAATRDRWVRSPNGSFAQQVEHLATWNLPEPTECAELVQLPEVQEFQRFAHEDPSIAPQLGQMVGTLVGGSVYMTVEEILCRTIRASVDVHPPLRFDPARFADFYPRLQSGLLEPDVVHVIVVPLYGVVRAPERIDIDPQLAVGLLSDDEIDRAIQGNLVPSLFGPTSPVVAVPTHAVRITYKTAKLVEEPDDGRRPSTEPTNKRVAPPPSVENALSLLRLYKPGGIGAFGEMHYIEWGFERGLMTYRFRPVSAQQMAMPEYTLTDADRDPLRELWRAMSSAGASASKGVQMALRRLSYSGERARSEDQLVDLMIAAEALFLSDLGRDRSELGYRLALRAAKFAESRDGQREVYDLFRQAYSARSVLVHGSGQPKVSLPDRTVVELADFVVVLEQHLRAAIRKAVLMTASGPFSVHWDDLIVGPRA